MTPGVLEAAGLLLGAGAAVAVVAWVARPLFGGPMPLDTPDPRAVALLARREVALSTLRDLDADHDEGRIEDAAYQGLRAQVVAEGASTLAALDRLAETAAGRSADLAARVASDLAARVGADTVAGDASKCPSCGQTARPGDAFCSRCGAPLDAEADGGGR